ncbi:hypothetical protein ACFX16_043174 [Malus domestica]
MEQFKSQPRLPKFAVPKLYDLRLKPDLAACKFGGFVDIDFDIVANTKFIFLNAAELFFNAGSVFFAHGCSSKVIDVHLLFKFVELIEKRSRKESEVFKPTKAETFFG